MKSHIAANPATNAKELDSKVDEEFNKVADNNWTKYYRHVQKFEDKYAEAVDDCCLVSDDEKEGDNDDGADGEDDDNYGSDNDDEAVMYSF